MALNGYVDGELDIMCEGLFDNIEDLLDFSTDDEAFGGTMDSVAAAGVDGSGGGGGGGGGHACQPIAPPPVTATPVPVASDVNKICDDVYISEDWITDFLDDSNFDLEFRAATAINAAAPKEIDSIFQTFSPVSVLEESNNISGSENTGGSSSSYSSTSSSSASTNGSSNETVYLAPVGPTMMLVPGRARSKRPRRAAPVPAHVTAPIVNPASDGPPAVQALLPECESYGESCCPAPMMRKKKKKSHSAAGGGNSRSEDGAGARKCQHCGIQKTPQWRAGPTGPKTLCNACGVRYKSGRLFPEYRPAASPTFVPSIHSNSHKKVVEIRNNVCQQKAASGMRLPKNPAAKNCDLLAYIGARE